MAQQIQQFKNEADPDHARDLRIADHDAAQERIVAALAKVVEAYGELWEARNDERLMGRIDPFDIVKKKAESMRQDVMTEVFQDIANPAIPAISEERSRTLDLINRLAIEVGCS